MALAVTLLLSVVPLKTPMVALGFLDGPANAITHPLSDNGLSDGATLSHDRDQSVLSPVEALLISANEREEQAKYAGASCRWIVAGIRANASLSPRAARRIALPPHTRQRLRAPPTGC